MDKAFMENTSVTADFNNSYNATEIIGRSSWILATVLLRNISIPMIVIFGILGHIISCLVYLNKEMREKPCTVFLFSLSIVDIVFLLSLLITWLDSQVLSLLQTAGACQCLVFTTYVSSFLSVCFIASLTCERWFAINSPVSCRHTFSRRTQQIMVTVFVLIALVAYAYIFWAVTISQLDNHAHCQNTSESLHFLKIANWIDTFVTMIIPFCFIATLNFLIIRKLNRHPDHRLTRNRIEETSALNVDFKQQQPEIDSLRVNGSTRMKLKNQITRMLLVVSITFLVLNLPSHAFRLLGWLKDMSLDNQNVTIEFHFFQELANMLHYLTFCCNFLLYGFCGNDFRKTLYLLLKCRSTSEIRKRTVLAKLRATQKRSTTKL